MSDIAQWVEKFRGFDAQLSVSRYVALFHSEGNPHQIY